MLDIGYPSVYDDGMTPDTETPNINPLDLCPECGLHVYDDSPGGCESPTGQRWHVEHLPAHAPHDVPLSLLAEWVAWRRSIVEHPSNRAGDIEPFPVRPLRLVDDLTDAQVDKLGRIVRPLTKTEGPILTYDVGSLGAGITATVAVSADRIGFHIEPAGDGRERRDYVTIAPMHAGRPIVLVHLPDTPATVRLLAVVELAIADDLAGVLSFDATPYPSGSGWFVSGSPAYTDAEGVVL